jgi:predicted dehydrogenase
MMTTPSSTRRDFLKTSTVLASGAAVLGAASLNRNVHAAGSDIIKIGLIGCGGRGGGAAVNAMNAEPGVHLTAMTDLFPDRAKQKRELLKKEKPDQVAVDDAHCFSGLDGYKALIESVDVVLIACCGKYHPMYLRAAIEAGKHVFLEKPHGIDPVGVRTVAAACQLAKEKNLSIVSGLNGRFHPPFQETVKRVHDGAIGEIVAIQETSLRPPYSLCPRRPDQTEMEFQFNNQFHFGWLSGDDGLQSHSHNLDRATWVMQGQTPVSAYGIGGRAATFGEVYGNVFDHQSVVFEYANGVRMYALCTTQYGCHQEWSSVYLGTKGRCDLVKAKIEGETNWHFQGDSGNSYDLEHKALFSAIRSGKPINCGDYMVASTFVAVMGQLASYSGKKLTYEQISQSDFEFAPKVADVSLNMEPPVKPDEKGNYSVPLPGIAVFNI